MPKHTEVTEDELLDMTMDNLQIPQEQRPALKTKVQAIRSGTLGERVRFTKLRKDKDKDEPK